jgi:hypothetical protein
MRALSYLLILATGAVCIFNGTLFSPLYDSVAYFLYLFTRGAPYLRPDVLAYMTSLLMALLTLLLAGIPAAAYERLRGFKESSLGSLFIWLVAATLLTLPALLRLVGED